MTLGEMIRDARVKQGMTVQELADRSRVDIQILENVEDGRNVLDAAQCLTLSQYIGISYDSLIAACHQWHHMFWGAQGQELSDADFRVGQSLPDLIWVRRVQFCAMGNDGSLHLIVDLGFGQMHSARPNLHGIEDLGVGVHGGMDTVAQYVRDWFDAYANHDGWAIARFNDGNKFDGGAHGRWLVDVFPFSRDLQGISLATSLSEAEFAIPWQGR